MNDIKTTVLADLIKSRFQEIKSPGLVVGCGSGLEASVLSKRLDIDIIGIDPLSDFLVPETPRLRLVKGDAMALDFDDDQFGFIYSYHALEHIKNPVKALTEMRRVLRPGGAFLVGTPNKSRLIGYLGSKKATLKDKLLWNTEDWIAKATNRFSNELGAHAGFTCIELKSLLDTHLGIADDISVEYYKRLYQRYALVISGLHKTKTDRFLFPCVYFIGSA